MKNFTPDYNPDLHEILVNHIAKDMLKNRIKDITESKNSSAIPIPHSIIRDAKIQIDEFIEMLKAENFDNQYNAID